MWHKIILLLIICASFSDCAQKEEQILFELKDNVSTGLNFQNNLTDTNDFNVYKYRNYYNGGGVAIGDINNDGLQDVYMVANQTVNKLIQYIVFLLLSFDVKNLF